jgi:O-acetyl-ADP-ribose deacetylase (regulator of RNase III)
LRARTQTLVNTVNCVGVMGKGIAATFKKRYPAMFDDYVRRCEHGEVRLGEPYLWTGTEPWVLNFPTKDHWRSVSRLEDIERGLEYLVEHYQQWGIQSLAVPPLGCGRGARLVGRRPDPSPPSRSARHPGGAVRPARDPRTAAAARLPR